MCVVLLTIYIAATKCKFEGEINNSDEINTFSFSNKVGVVGQLRETRIIKTYENNRFRHLKNS